MYGSKEVTERWQQQNRLTHKNMTRDKTSLLFGRAHLHILKLEVVLEGIGRDEPQLTWRDRAGGADEHENKTMNNEQLFL